MQKIQIRRLTCFRTATNGVITSAFIMRSHTSMLSELKFLEQEWNKFSKRKPFYTKMSQTKCFSE